MEITELISFVYQILFHGDDFSCSYFVTQCATFNKKKICNKEKKSLKNLICNKSEESSPIAWREE